MLLCDLFLTPRTDIVGILPLQADLQFGILVHNVKEPSQKLSALLLGDTIDMLDMGADWENTLPPGDGVRAHNGMNGLELGADIGSIAARLVVELEPTPGRSLSEAGLLKSDTQALEELLIRLADLVIDFIPGCKKGIY